MRAAVIGSGFGGLSLADSARLAAGWRKTVDAFAVEQHLPLRGGYPAGDGLDHGGLAHAVAPEQAYHFALAHPQVDALQHVAQTVVGVNAFEFEHQCFSPK